MQIHTGFLISPSSPDPTATEPIVKGDTPEKPVPGQRPNPISIRPSGINKAFIRRRLLWLSTSLSAQQEQQKETATSMAMVRDIKDTQPSRRILRVVHSFLMPRPT